MNKLPEGYGFKDLTPLGRALDENSVLKNKLDIALEALEKIKKAKGGVIIIDDLGHKIEFNNYEGDIAIEALNKIEKIK